MYDVFKTIVQFNIQACFLVLAVIILRLLLRKAPRSLICALWTLVAVRLIFPFRVESVFSLVPDTEIAARTVGNYATERITSAVWEYPETFLNTTDNTVIKEKTDLIWNILPRIAAFIWAAGVVIMLIYAVFSYIKLYWVTRERVIIEKGVYICDHIPSPFILGIFRLRIFLPSNISEHDKPFVLAHEKAHIKRKDHLWKPLGFLLLSIYWFNPFLWAAYILLCRDIEAACDEKVIRELGSECKKPYAIALINSAASQKLISACPLAFGETNVKTRIKNVLSYKKPAFWIIIIAVVLSIAVAVCFLTNPINKEKLLPDDVYEFKYGDIDGDGMDEIVTLSNYSSSEKEKVLLSVYDAETYEQKYLPLSLCNTADIVKGDDNLLLEGYNLFSAPEDNEYENVFYSCSIAVIDDSITLDIISALDKTTPSEMVDRFFKANAEKFPMNPTNHEGWIWTNVKEEYYGGTYLDGAEQVILLTDISQENDYIPIGRDIRFQKCEYSLEYLEREIDSINRDLAKIRTNGDGLSDSIVELSLLDNQNKIEVCIYDMTDEKVKWFRDTFGDPEYLVLRNVTVNPNEDISEETIHVDPGIDPDIIFTNGKIVYISGKDCGIIIYDIENEEYKGMLSQAFLQDLGYQSLYATASADGSKVFLYDDSDPVNGSDKCGVLDMTSGNITAYNEYDPAQNEELFMFNTVQDGFKHYTMIPKKDGISYLLSVPNGKLKNMELRVKKEDGTEKTYKIFA